jgi:hypothetical protein
MDFSSGLSDSEVSPPGGESRGWGCHGEGSLSGWACHPIRPYKLKESETETALA